MKRNNTAPKQFKFICSTHCKHVVLPLLILGLFGLTMIGATNLRKVNRPDYSVKVYQDADENILEWRNLAIDSNIQYFIVEKSVGKMGFAKVAKVDVQGYSRDSAALFLYLDKEVGNSAPTKYRLKSVTDSGKVCASKVIVTSDIP